MDASNHTSATIFLAADDLVLLFPGQGMQHVGMGQALAHEHAEAQRTFAEADAALGFSLSQLCWQGPEDALTRTAYAQPAILTHSIAALRVLEAEAARTGRPFVPKAAAGHSLGEWTALVAAGALPFADALRLVHLRGQFMEAAVPPGVGVMAAVLGLEASVLTAICEEAAEDEIVAIATFNGPGNIVISGHRGAVARASILATERGATGVVEIPVSTPFHCPLMAPAAEQLRVALRDVAFAAPAFPIRSTVVDAWVTDERGITELLVAQMTAPVRWHEAITALSRAGVSRALGLGPGKPLVGMVRRIARGFRVEVKGEPVDFKPTS